MKSQGRPERLKAPGCCQSHNQVSNQTSLLDTLTSSTAHVAFPEQITRCEHLWSSGSSVFVFYSFRGFLKDSNLLHTHDSSDQYPPLILSSSSGAPKNSLLWKIWEALVCNRQSLWQSWRWQLWYEAYQAKGKAKMVCVNGHKMPDMWN